MIARGQSGGFKRNDNLPRIRAHDRARSARAVDRHPRTCRLPHVLPNFASTTALRSRRAAAPTP